MKKTFYDRNLRRDYQIDLDIEADDVDISLDRYELEDILEHCFDESIFEFYKNLPEEKKLQKGYSHDFRANVNLPMFTVDLSFDDVEHLVDQLNEDDKVSLFERDFNCGTKSDISHVEIPNLEARHEFEQFYESFKKKWNL